MLAIHLPVSDETIRALCWTLIHSLWQGALLALLAAAVLFFARKKSAALRYNLLASLLSLFTGSVFLTFFQIWNKTGAGRITPFFSNERSNPAPQVQAVLALPEPASIRYYFDAFAGYCNTHATTIVILWSLVFLLKCVRMVLELRLIQGLRQRGTNVPPPIWQRKVRELAGMLHIHQTVTLLESALVQVPATIGFLKPVILVPVGLLARLPADQVEAILLHELAHIRRRDFLVNLLQHFVETLFFFNPAVLWVSALLREEREHCCDDIAVAALNNKAGYLNALMSFEQFRATASPMAPAFPGRKGQLLHRIKRIIGQGNTKIFSNMEKITLIIIVLLIGTIAFYPSTRMQAQNVKTRQNTSIRYVNIEGDGTATNPQRMTIKDSEGKTYELNRIGKDVTDLQVNGQKVPQGQWGDYKWLITAVDEQIERDMAQADADRKQAVRDREQAVRDREQAVRDREQAKRDAEQAGKDREQAKRDVEQAKRDAEQAKRDAEQAKLDVEQAKRDAEQAKRDAEQAKLDVEQAKRDAEQAKRDAEQAKKDRAMMENLISDLIRDGIVKDKKNLQSVELTDTGMEVNGQKQPKAIFERYKAKYQEIAGYTIQYRMRSAE